MESLKIVLKNTALKVRALRNIDDDKNPHLAGEEWQIAGPFTYIPRVEEEIVEVVKSVTITSN